MLHLRKSARSSGDFYLRIKARRGHNVAIIALARKILCILYHLLMNREMYVEDNESKKSKSKRNYRTSSPRAMDIQEMIDFIRQSGYEVQMSDDSLGASSKRNHNREINIERGACG
jgi:transposase